jgi:hypothetical protein
MRRAAAPGRKTPWPGAGTELGPPGVQGRGWRRATGQVPPRAPTPPPSHVTGQRARKRRRARSRRPRRSRHRPGRRPTADERRPRNDGVGRHRCAVVLGQALRWSSTSK